jgi:hypothetical protein
MRVSILLMALLATNAIASESWLLTAHISGWGSPTECEIVAASFVTRGYNGRAYCRTSFVPGSGRAVMVLVTPHTSESACAEGATHLYQTMTEYGLRARHTCKQVSS